MYSTIWYKCYRWTKMKIFYEFLILCKLTTNSNIWETSEIFANITGGLLAITGSSLALIPYSACLRKKYVWEINSFQSIRDFKTSYVLTIKFISTYKEAPKLLWNIQVVLSSNKIQLLQKQQFQLSYKKTAGFYVLYFTSSLKKYGKYALLFSQSHYSYFYVLIQMIINK